MRITKRPALAFLTAFLFVFIPFSVIYSQQPGDEQLICNQPVPTGWVCIQVGAACATGSIYNLNDYNRTIKYHVGYPPGTELHISAEIVPAGWIKTAVSLGPALPAIVNGQPGVAFYENYTIVRYEGLPPGSVLTTVDAITPAGWVTTNIGSVLVGNTILQVRTILKTEGYETADIITIVDTYPPFGWVAIDIGSLMVAGVIYETRKMIQISSMNPAQTYTLVGLEPPPGWLPVDLTTKIVGATNNELLVIENYHNLPINSERTVIDSRYVGSLPPDGWTTLATGTRQGLVSTYNTYTIKKQQNRISGLVNGTWKPSGNPYIINGTVQILQQSKLNIEPGVEIHTYSDNDMISVYGKLIAKGNASDSVRFRGMTDPQVPVGRPGGSIIFQENSGSSLLEYVSINKWGDNYSEQNALNIRTAAVTIRNSTISNSRNTGINIGYNLQPQIVNNKFSGNRHAIDATIKSLQNVSANDSANIMLVQDINANEVLTLHKPGTNSYYFLPVSFTLYQGGILTIQPGTELRWLDDNPYNANIFTVQGTLIAIGTDQDSIRFTGHERWKTNPGIAPPGYLIFTHTSSNNVLDHLVIDKMGAKYQWQDYAAIQINTSSMQIKNTRIRNSASIGISITGQPCTPLITGNQFNHNEQDIQAAFWGVRNLRQNSNAKIVLVQGTLDSNLTLVHPGHQSYYQLQENITVSTGKTLTIAPGTLIDMGNVRGQLTVDGTLQAVGTPDSLIRFTRLHPSLGTNNTGNIVLSYYSNNSVLDYVIIDSMGSQYNSTGALELRTSSVTASHLQVSNNQYAGIVCTESNAEITHSVIKNNPTGIQSWTCSPVFSDCEIAGNINYGVQVFSNQLVQVDARNCLWGHSSGPYHALLNPGGQGNAVSDKVLFDPFLPGNIFVRR